jgi:hypothetical protein
MNFLRDVVVPLATLTTLVGCLYFTYVLFALGSVGGGISVALLSAGIGYFVYYDARRLLAKIG